VPEGVLSLAQLNNRIPATTTAPPPTPISLIPAAFHRHAAAAAAANPSGKGLRLASVGISHLALYGQCHCRHCRQTCHFPLTHWQKPLSKGEVPGLSAPLSLVPALFFVGDDDDDDDKAHRAAAAAAAKPA